MKYLLLCIATLTSGSVYCRPVMCYEDPTTSAQQCIDSTQVYEENGIRSTSLYSGGPKSVQKTAFTIHVNCATQVTHLKDRQGVSFAGGDGNETAAVRSLRTWVCEAKPKIIKSKNTKQ